MKSKVLSKVASVLREKTGEFYIQTLIGIFMFLLVLMMGMAVTPLMISKIRIDFAADEIARYVAMTGDSDITAESINGILNTYNIDLSNVTISADNPEAMGETRIQLADGFTVTVVCPMQVNFGGFNYGFNIDVTSVSRGRSEVYWKVLDEP